MFRFGPVTRILALPTLSRLALVLLVVEAVFIAESFTTLMENALRYGGSSGDVALLLSFVAPDILDLALALGLLIALYMVLLDTRARGELVILATNGIPWWRISGFALSLGVVTGGVSLLIGGAVVPAADYAERVKFAELRANHVLTQITQNSPHDTRQTIDDTTFIATPPRDIVTPLTGSAGDVSGRGQLFIFDKLPRGGWRVGLSRDWGVQDPTDDDPRHRLAMTELRAYEGPPAGDKTRPIAGIDVSNAGFDFRLDHIVPEPDRTAQKHETRVRLAAEESPRLSAVGARALLCPFAALLAIAAVLAGGGGLGRFLALPLAALAVMIFDVLGKSALSGFAQTIPPAVLIPIAILAYLGLPLAYIIFRGEALMKPPRGT